MEWLETIRVTVGSRTNGARAPVSIGGMMMSLTDASLAGEAALRRELANRLAAYADVWLAGVRASVGNAVKRRVRPDEAATAGPLHR